MSDETKTDPTCPTCGCYMDESNGVWACAERDCLLARVEKLEADLRAEREAREENARLRDALGFHKRIGADYRGGRDAQ